ncbi:MAG: efflux RND transporter periplasmic adaptor subunit, partial [Cyanobacteria bacterium]|nr:efflux RND transporter periplasmic adaptor subunit [Cyanobacteriota bacterium]
FNTKPVNIPIPVVSVKQPQLQDMALYVTQTGTTVAYNSVNLVARIEGYLDAIKFKDGSFVKKGDLLFIVQPEPYMEQLKAAQATVTAQKAASQYSQSEYARQQRMFKENATSKNNMEKWLAKMHEAQAEVDKAVANEEIAAINYSYTHILAPFDGRIGRHLVDVGNLVGKGAATTLATLEQINPIYIYFNLNELDLIKLRNAAHSEGLKPKDINKISAYINMQNESGFQHVAKLDFVNTSLNAATGTMEFRAVLENKDYKFVPGLFVQVQVAITRPKKELTVPDVAVLYDQIGPYLLTVDNNNTVVLKRVTLGTVEKGMRAITKGLTEKDRVIVNGLQNATPGNKVTPMTQTASYF